MRIFILEDELPAYEKLKSYILEEIQDAELIGWARSNQEASEIYDATNPPELIFSDIELLDGLSFDFFNGNDVKCPVIFCTAFDQYLLRAFQTNGISYLLKPYDKETFAQAVIKYESLFSKQGSDQLITPGILENIKEALSGDQNQYKKRFSIKKKDGIKLLSVDNISLIQASGDFCILHDNKGQKHTANYTLSQIEKLLDPSTFFRINRSEIIQINYIEKIEQHFKNRLQISINNGKIKVYTSGSKTPHFRKWIDS